MRGRREAVAIQVHFGDPVPQSLATTHVGVGDALGGDGLV